MSDEPKVLLVCSPGGHLQQMLTLAPAWRDLEHHWVTLRAPDTEYELAAEPVTFGYGPTNRSLTKLAQNVVLARRGTDATDPGPPGPVG